MASRVTLLFFTAFIVTLASGLRPITARQNAGRSGDIELPPITWLCPMNGVTLADGSIHADVYEDQKGNCPICKMALVAARLDSIWTCPVHSVIAEKQGGKCPIDRRDLVPVTVAVSWTCSANPEIDQITPGRCPDGSAMTVKYTPRPHGNHNPQHGGQFFMAPDNWTHLEGTFPQERLVRLYLYDDYTKPLSTDKLKSIQGRIITKTAPAGGPTSEVSFPLTPARNGQYLEARVDVRTAPALMVAKIKLKPDGPEHHFDFTFTEFTKEPVPARAPVSEKSTTASVPAPSAGTVASTPAGPRPAPAPAVTENRGVLEEAASESVQAAGATTAVAPGNPAQMAAPAVIQVAIPDTVEGIVAQISVRNQRIRELISVGSFSEVWLPAFEAKDLALAMGAQGVQLPTYKRRLLEPTVSRLLHSAWLLDAFGDLGNREQITAAYAEFESAVASIESLIQGVR